MFNLEHGIALHAIQANGASSQGEGEVCWFFSSCGGNLESIPELRWGWPFKARLCSVTSEILSSYGGHRLNLLEAWQGNKDSYRSQPGDPGYFSSCHSDVGIPIIFNKSQASSPFEALNSACLSRCQRDVKPPVQISRGPSSFSRVSTLDSDIPSPYEMKDEHAFKPMQGNPSFLSRGILVSLTLDEKQSGSL